MKLNRMEKNILEEPFLYWHPYKSEIRTDEKYNFNNNDEIVNDIKDINLVNEGKACSDKGGLLGKIMINRTSPKKIRVFKTNNLYLFHPYRNSFIKYSVKNIISSSKK